MVVVDDPPAPALEPPDVEPGALDPDVEPAEPELDPLDPDVEPPELGLCPLSPAPEPSAMGRSLRPGMSHRITSAFSPAAPDAPLLLRTRKLEP